jgi:hypothetical protein
LHNNNPDIAKKVRKIQIEEQELNAKQEEYKAEVAQILARMRVDNMPSMAEDIIESVKRRGGERDEELQRSCCLLNVYIDDQVIRDNSSSVASYISYDKSASVQKLNKSNTPLLALIIQPVLGNSKSSSSSRRSVSFLA